MNKEFKTHTMEHRPKKMKKPKGGEEKNVKVEDVNARFILSNPDVVERVYTMGTEIMNRAKVNCIQCNWAVNVVILTLECISGWMMINDQTYQRVHLVEEMQTDKKESYLCSFRRMRTWKPLPLQFMRILFN
ncbi:unnamed protein product [Eruca vesicaria subsp. sativa]|uniref:Uncharacterized protein n=1 Tax=Eruca vesicaria subsp. sativa TaxID=29727 RepID=A0ABC8KSS3_ERUVS|nr:unnamed protein product [Eruca vesicaria subsp. sativa]